MNCGFHFDRLFLINLITFCTVYATVYAHNCLSNTFKCLISLLNLLLISFCVCYFGLFVVCKPGTFVAAAVIIVMVVVVVVIVAAVEVQPRTTVNRQVSGRDVVLLWRIVADTSNKLLPMTGRNDSDHRYEKQHVV